MAAILTLVARTPEMLKYQWAYDGLGGAGSGQALRTQVQMIADCVGPGPSPLRALLASIVADGAWNTLPQGAQLSLYQTIIDLPVATSVATSLAIVSASRQLRVLGKDGNAGNCLVEIRFHHTLTR